MNINRFKQLLESTMGNVKPLIVEVTDEELQNSDGYNVTYKVIFDGKYTGHRLGAHLEGKGTFTNKNGVVFRGIWGPGADKDRDTFDKSDTPENKQYEGVMLSKLAEVKPGEQRNLNTCKQPEPDSFVINYPEDKNYVYAKDESGNCWWTENKTNNKVFNLNKLAETNPKIQKSIEYLNTKIQ